ncbi:pimeloyl-ACP methyl ester carboxylesterase [Bradyrhizobium ottawaense]
MKFEDFEAADVQAEEARIFIRRAGSGPALLLLHGFPQTHLMNRVAPAGVEASPYCGRCQAFPIRNDRYACPLTTLRSTFGGSLRGMAYLSQPTSASTPVACSSPW